MLCGLFAIGYFELWLTIDWYLERKRRGGKRKVRRFATTLKLGLMTASLNYLGISEPDTFFLHSDRFQITIFFYIHVKGQCTRRTLVTDFCDALSTVNVNNNYSSKWHYLHKDNK